MREQGHHGALENRTPADRKQLLRLRAAEPLAASSGRDDRCDVHRVNVDYMGTGDWGLGLGPAKARRTTHAEKRAHLVGFSLDRTFRLAAHLRRRRRWRARDSPALSRHAAWAPRAPAAGSDRGRPARRRPARSAAVPWAS